MPLVTVAGTTYASAYSIPSDKARFQPAPCAVIMNRKQLIQKILSGTADNNIPFNATVNLLLRLGFELRAKGSHRIFTHEDLAGVINIQPTKENRVKPYQVKQIRKVFNTNRIE